MLAKQLAPFQPTATAAAISGEWYQTVIEYEATASSISPLSIVRNERLSITHQGGDSFLIQTEGEEAETFELSQSGTLWQASFAVETEDGIQQINIRARLVEEGLVFVNQHIVWYGEHNQLYHAEGRSSVMTRQPVPEWNELSWSGNWSAMELGAEAYNGTTDVDTFDGEFDLALHPMPGNTFQVRQSDAESNDIGETLVVSGGMLVLDRNTVPNRIIYQDSQLRVRETDRRFRIRALPINENVVFVTGQTATLALIEPQPGIFARAVQIVSSFENFTLLLQRNESPLQPLPPLATSMVGKRLNEHATVLAEGSLWHHIPWFGYFMPLGGSYAHHVEYGTVFFGADVRDTDGDVPFWIYLAALDRWLVFSPDYPEGQAWDPILGELITVSVALNG